MTMSSQSSDDDESIITSQTMEIGKAENELQKEKLFISKDIFSNNLICLLQLW